MPTPPQPGDPALPSIERQATRVRVIAVRGGTVETREDRLTGEEPMAIRACGPGQDAGRRRGHDADPRARGGARGRVPGDRGAARRRPGHGGHVRRRRHQLAARRRGHGPPRRPFDASRVAERHFVATASCGICGKATLDEIEVRCAPIPAGPVVEPAVLLALPGALREAQAVFEATGGLHAAGLFDASGRLLELREDVGRHNALDKLIGGQALAGNLPLHDRIVLVSGRASFELVQKAAVAGVPILAAVSAPSDLAVEAAERLGRDARRLPARRRLQRLRAPGARSPSSPRLGQRAVTSSRTRSRQWSPDGLAVDVGRDRAEPRAGQDVVDPEDPDPNASSWSGRHVNPGPVPAASWALVSPSRSGCQPGLGPGPVEVADDQRRGRVLQRVDRRADLQDVLVAVLRVEGDGDRADRPVQRPRRVDVEHLHRPAVAEQQPGPQDPHGRVLVAGDQRQARQEPEAAGARLRVAGSGTGSGP